ncbi:hypothetical protein AUR64_13865 [Haloprofundus marisrubri]|uniref:SMP-30/Gluconolactonase/LRE-like region domain-containing protein n=1 Tax=Haloprofundus marisrubri TaxID=1514971 RepID=A0A0W1R659_9EURY|nr:twin-arginine translocation signal domain-containing protein [Haloprofundus marisrubri]KTG08893.1 hypothetical protein AUR64_13865 [Haloprofundus marisrubri]
MEHSRRTFLKVTGVSTAAAFLGTGAAAASQSQGRLTEVVSVTDPVPENVGFDWNGDLYIGVTGGSVRRLPAGQTDESGLSLDATELVAEYPGSVAGVLVEDGILYAAVNGEMGGVYALDLRASSAEPQALATLVGSDEEGFVNDFYQLGSRLLVTESFGGVVYELPLTADSECEPTVWADSDLLATPSFGANGITAIRGDVFVAVTRVTENTGRIVRIPVACDGSAGEPEVYVEGPQLFGADGLTSRGAELYVALNGQNRIAVVDDGGNNGAGGNGNGGGNGGNGNGNGNANSTGGRVRTVFAGGALSFPSEVVFDPTDPDTAFVCNFSNSAPEQGGVLRGALPGSARSQRSQ